MPVFSVRAHANISGIPGAVVSFDLDDEPSVKLLPPWKLMDITQDDDSQSWTAVAFRDFSLNAANAEEATTMVVKQTSVTGWEERDGVTQTIQVVRVGIDYPVPETPETAEALLRYEPHSNALSTAIGRYFGALQVAPEMWQMPWISESEENPLIGGVNGLTTDPNHAAMVVEHRQPGAFPAVAKHAVTLMEMDGVTDHRMFARYLLLALIVPADALDD
jgi:hypothetical protein